MSGSLLARSCGGRLLTRATSWHHFFLFAWTCPFLSGSLIFFQSHAAGPTPGPGPSLAVVIPPPQKMNLSIGFSLFFCVEKAKSCLVPAVIYGAILEVSAPLFSRGTRSGPSKQPRPAPWKDDPPSLPQQDSHIPELCIFACSR